jgi:hypothetical protein
LTIALPIFPDNVWFHANLQAEMMMELMVLMALLWQYWQPQTQRQRQLSVKQQRQVRL